MTPEEGYARGIDPNVFSDIKDHLPYLRALAHGTVVEIGVRGGDGSTSALLLGVAGNGGHLYSIDINPACGTDIFPPRNPHWTFIQGHSRSDAERILETLPDSFDVLFIDGSHDYISVLSDLMTYGPRVKPCGVILLHDTDLEGSGVRDAISDYCEETGWTATFRTGSYGLGVLRA